MYSHPVHHSITSVSLNFLLVNFPVPQPIIFKYVNYIFNIVNPIAVQAAMISCVPEHMIKGVVLYICALLFCFLFHDSLCYSRS